MLEYLIIPAGENVMHSETRLQDLARFRTIAEEPKGERYLLLENAAGSWIFRLTPCPSR